MIWEGRRRVKEVASHWPHVRPWIYRIQNLGLCYQANQSSISTLGWNTQTVCTSDWILVSISEECVLKSQRVRSIPHILLGLNCMSSSCSLKPCTHSSQPKNHFLPQNSTDLMTTTIMLQHRQEHIHEVDHHCLSRSPKLRLLLPLFQAMQSLHPTANHASDSVI